VIIGSVVCAGIALAVLGVPTHRFVVSVDPYHLKPTFVLLENMKSSDWVVAGRALAEMDRRIGTWRVSQGQLKQFARVVWPCRLRVRPVCIASEGVPYQLRMEESDIRGARAIPGLPGSYQRDAVLGIEPRILASRCWWDDTEPEGWPFPNLNHEPMPVSIDGKAMLPVGHHTLHYQLQVAYMRAKHDGSRDDTILRQEISLDAMCEVVETEPQDYINVIQDPSAGDALRMAISSVELRGIWSAFGSGRDTLLFFLNLAAPMPIDVAFLVIARIDGREYRVGEVLCRKGQVQWQDQKILYCSYNGPHAASADIILRGSPEVARNSLEMIGTWDGQIEFRDIPIRSSQ
jgi:hypothetical protein